MAVVERGSFRAIEPSLSETAVQFRRIERSIDRTACRSFVDVLRFRAQHQPDAKAFTFLIDGETEGGVLTFSRLEQRARAVAASLLDLCTGGERVVLLFPAGLDFIAAFLGCLYAGVIAVPVAMPRRQQGIDKLVDIVADCGATAILTDKASIQEVGTRLSPVCRTSIPIRWHSSSTPPAPPDNPRG
jgi:acyl-CoA synthetase (AMP-forming)/AMP-acid ligase II